MGRVARSAGDDQGPPISIDDIRRALEARGSKIVKTPRGFRAQCPCHDDGNPSLDVDEGDGGTVLVKCRACPAGFLEVIKALELRAPSLRSSARRNSAPNPKRTPKPALRLLPLEDAIRAATPKAPGWRFQTEHLYRDEHGAERFRVLRFEQWNQHGERIDKSFKPVTPEGGGWRIGAPPAPRPLYRLPELSSHPRHVIVLVEGEKAADALAKLFAEAGAELCAPTWAGGTGGVGQSDFSPLGGRRVALWPDFDEAGAKAMHSVEAALGELEAGASVQVLEPPELPPKGDAFDWIEAGRRAGRTPRDLVAELGGWIAAGTWRSVPEVPDLRPFDPAPHEQATVPMDLLRETAPVLAELVETIARGSSVDPIMPLGAALGLASFAAARLFERIDYGAIQTVPVLWFCTVAEPSERKSTVSRLVTSKAIEELDRERDEFRAARATDEALAEAAKERIVDLRGKFAKAKGEAARAAEAALREAVERASAHSMPPLPFARLGTDSTPEAVLYRLAEADGLGLLVGEEGKLFDLVGGHYSGRPDISTLNSAWDGGSIRSARVSADRREIVVLNARLAIVLCVQPGVLANIAGSKTQEAGGFLARWLFVVPEARAGTRFAARTMDEARRARPEAPPEWLDRILELFEAARAAPTKGVLEIEEAAYRVWAELYDLAELAQAEDSGLEHLRDLLGKLAEQVVRIAGALHVVRHGARATGLRIEESTMRTATELGALFALHAFAARRIVGGRWRRSPAEIALRWAIRRGGPFAVRDLHKNRRGVTAKQIEGWFEELVERGYLLRFRPKRGETGRPPECRYVLRPDLASAPRAKRERPSEALRMLISESVRQNGQNPSPRRSADSVSSVLSDDSADEATRLERLKKRFGSSSRDDGGAE